MKGSLILLVLVFLCLHAPSFAQECSDNEAEMFITFHPHMDAFWLNSDRELTSINFIPAGFLYQANQRNSKTIYNSMLQALNDSSHPERRFMTTEVFFFKDWYDYINEESKQAVKKLLKNGNLEIVNAGWVENDEAVTYYDDIIEQYSYAMNYMMENFNYSTRIGWATDSFGHSHSQAAILNELGFEMQGIERLDERYINQHNEGPLMEFYWKAVSDSNNRTYGGLMTHIQYFLHEVNDYRNANEQYIVREYQQVTQVMKKDFQKNILFRFLGNDFEEFIPKQFTFLQKVMQTLNANKSPTCPGYHYGNPSEYMKKIVGFWKQKGLKTRAHDFIPDWDQARYWTGYYTTDPALKKQCKDTSRRLHFLKRALLHQYTAKKVPSLAEEMPKLNTYEELIALQQHHDGITATSKHHIELDMMARMRKADQEMVTRVRQIMNVSANAVECDLVANNNVCILKNDWTDFTLDLYNFGVSRKETIQVVLAGSNLVKPLDTTRFDVFCQNSNYQNCRIVLEVPLEVPKTTIRFVKYNNPEVNLPKTGYEATNGDFKNIRYTIDGNNIVRFDASGHYLSFSYYTSRAFASAHSTMNWTKDGMMHGKTQMVSDGIYIMHNSGKLDPFGGRIVSMSFSKGNNYAVLNLEYENAIKSSIILDSQSPLELDIRTQFWPKFQGAADYFLKISSDVKGGLEFYHDSNGYLVSKRKVDSRPDYTMTKVDNDRINGNTFPVTSFIYIKDSKNKFVVSTDRAEGGSIYEENEILMNLDRFTNEDGKGVGESYVFSTKNTFRHRAIIVSVDNDIERRWQNNNDNIMIGFAAQSGSPNLQTVARPVSQNGDSAYLKYTVAYLNKNSLVVRVQNMAQFKVQTIQMFDEASRILNIPAFQLRLPYASYVQSYLNGFVLNERYNWMPDSADSSNTIDIHKNKVEAGGKITLQPLQIRSFRITLRDSLANEPSPSTIDNIDTSKPAEPITPVQTLRVETPMTQASHRHLKSRCF